MNDYSFNTIIDTNSLQIGQVVRINITDEGIFRVFYNDINGNMYCGLSRQSNYKSVIFDSNNKSNLDISNGYINTENFYKPLYGGTQHPEELRFSNNIGNFYVFIYDTPGSSLLNNSNHGLGPFPYFSEIQNEVYVKQGQSSGYIYDKTGFSSILKSGKNLFFDKSNRPHPEYNFYNQYGFCIGSSVLTNEKKVYSKGIGIPFPDLLDLYGQNVNGVQNKPLNTNLSYLSNLSDISIPENSTISRFTITTVPYGEEFDTFPDLSGNIETTKSVNFTITNKRSKFIWLDENNNSTQDSNGSVITSNTDDSYYKGNFYIYAHCNLGDNLQGNIYIERKGRTAMSNTHTCKLYDKFSSNSYSLSKDISDIYVDLDLDLSKNAINSNFNYIYAKPYYVISSDASGQVIYGNVPYNLSNSSQPSPTSQKIIDIQGGGGGKYCKIVVDKTSNNWSTTRFHIIYYANNGSDYGTSPNIIKKNTLRWATGIADNSIDRTDKITSYENCGLFPSIDIFEDKMYVAYLCKGNSNYSDPSGIGYSMLDMSNPDKNTWSWTDTTIIANYYDLGESDGIEKYIDLSNNNPISLKISPYDKSIHICYQKFNQNGTTSIGYWTNSKNITDISGIEGNINFLGIKSYGKTIDLSKASVELFWDVSQCFTLFSRDYTRLNSSGNTIGKNKGIGDTNIKILGHPEGGRNSKFVENINENNIILYKANILDKFYFITKIKTDNLNSEYQKLFCIGNGNTSSNTNENINGGFFFGFYFKELIWGVNGTSFSNSTWSSPQTFNPIGSFGQTRLGDGCYINNSNTKFIANNNNKSQVELSPNTNYEIKFYYNKTNNYLRIDIIDLDNTTEKKFEMFDLFLNGGYNIQSGNLSIGCGSHINPLFHPTNFDLYKLTIYSTDISNIPQFDISKNGFEISNSTTNHSSFFDNNNNQGLAIEPVINKYQIVNIINGKKPNNDIIDISGLSYTKSVILNDIYYLSRIEDYIPSRYGECVEGLSKFSDGEIWGFGYISDIYGNRSSTVWKSPNNGFTWITSTPNIDGFSNFKINNIFTFTDSNNFTNENSEIIYGKWVFICGDTNVLYYTSNYINSNPTGTLGSNWYYLSKPILPAQEKIFSIIINKGFFPLEASLGYTPWPLFNPENDEISNNWEILNESEIDSNIIDNFPTSLKGILLRSTIGDRVSPSGIHNGASYLKIENINYPDSLYIEFNLSSEEDYDKLVILEQNQEDAFFTDWTFPDTFVGKVANPGEPYLPSNAPRRGYSGNVNHLEVIQKKYCIIYFYKDSSVDDGRDGAILKIYNNINFSSIYATKINTIISQNVFPNINRDNTDFHLYFGTKDGSVHIANFGKNRHLQTLNVTDNVLNNFSNIGTINAISFGQPYLYVSDLSDNLNNLFYGIIGTSNYVFTTSNGGALWDSKLYYPQSRGTTGVYVGQNTKFGEPINAHTYDISGFYIQTNSKPWLGYSGFLVANNNNNYDVSFNPLSNSNLIPQLNSNDYWEPQTLSLYDISSIDINIFENNYKVFISDLENTNSLSGLKYQQNDYVFNQNTLEPYNILYTKNSNYNIWQKIDFSPVNKNYKLSQLNYNSFKSMIPVDISNVILQIDGYFSNVNATGFYLLSRNPPRPSLIVRHPVLLTELTRVELEIRLDENNSINDLNGENNTVLFTNNSGGFKYDIITIFEYKELDIENPVFVEINRNFGFNNYKISSNIFQHGKRYIFRARLKNKYGFSYYSKETNPISIPAYDPFIENLQITSSLLENKISWNPGFTNTGQTVYAYDISKSVIPPDTLLITSIPDSNFQIKHNYYDISGVVGINSFGGGNLENIVIGEKVNISEAIIGLNTIISSNQFKENDSWNEAYALSYNPIYQIPNLDISLNFQISKDNSYFQIGFSKNNIDILNLTSLFLFSFKFVQENGNYKIKIIEETNTVYSSNYTFSASDNFTIFIKKNDDVLYYFNNILIHTSIGISKYPLNFLFSPFNSFDNTPSVTQPGAKNVQLTKVNLFDSEKKWTGDVTTVDFIDKDITFNYWYIYHITARAIKVRNEIKTRNYDITTFVGRAIPDNLQFKYNINKATLDISWNLSNTINDYMSIVWDISWNEQKKNGITTSGNKTLDNIGNGIQNYEYKGSNFNNLESDSIYSFQIRGIYSRNDLKNIDSYISPYSEFKIFNNLQESPSLIDVSYNILLDKIIINWSETSIPSKPDFYEIYLSNITSNKDISYNFIQINNYISDNSSNGLEYYPGTYSVKVRANYGGFQIPTNISLFSEWSDIKTFNVPYHKVKNVKIKSFNKNNEEDIIDVSYIKLDWDSMITCNLSNEYGIHIPDSFTIKRNWANKGLFYLPDYEKNISYNIITYTDQEWPLGENTTWPRQYKYDISGNFA